MTQSSQRIESPFDPERFAFGSDWLRAAANPGIARVHWTRRPPVGKRWHPQVINAPPTDDHVVAEVQVRDYGFSPAQQDEIWRRWREGQSFSLMGRALGAPMHHVRGFLYQSGGVRQAPQSGQRGI